MVHCVYSPLPFRLLDYTYNQINGQSYSLASLFISQSYWTVLFISIKLLFVLFLALLNSIKKKKMVLMCVGILSLYKRLLTLGACARVTVLAYVFT